MPRRSFEAGAATAWPMLLNPISKAPPMPRLLTLLATIGLTALPAAAITHVDLSHYFLDNTYALPAAADEASGVTYNWDTDTLFVIGDEGDALVEVSLTGTLVSQMTLIGPTSPEDDTEGVTYIGDGKFAIVEEREQDVFELPYVAGGSADFADLPRVSLGPNVGNKGFEGISYEPSTDAFFIVKEKDPQGAFVATIDFAAETGTINELFTPNLGVSDLSDIQALSTVPSLAGRPDADNLLIFSQEAELLMEVSRTGAILSTFDFDLLADDAEGVTLGPDGTIYVVGERPELFVLKPIPEPGTATLALGGLAGAALRRRRP